MTPIFCCSCPWVGWQRVVQVSCGWRHTVALTEGCNVFAVGEGQEQGSWEWVTLPTGVLSLFSL